MCMYTHVRKDMEESPSRLCRYTCVYSDVREVYSGGLLYKKRVFSVTPSARARAVTPVTHRGDEFGN